MRHLFVVFLYLCLAQNSYAKTQAPNLRLKFGQTVTTVSAGSALVEQDLGSLLTFLPSVLWGIPALRTRVGFHFLADIGSDLGLMPVSGIGASAYFYPWGVSHSYEKRLNGVIQQSYKNSLYLMVGMTPVNLNINSENEVNPDASISFSAFMIEGSTGIGYDYMLRENVALSLDLSYRFASSVSRDNSDESLTYSGITVFFSVSTSYF